MDQIIAQLHLDLMPTQIVVILQLLEKRIFAQLTNLVEWIKVTVIPMMNAKIICFVDQTIVLIHLGFYLQLIVVNQKVKKYNFIYFPYDLFPFFQLLTESCAMNYCQDGLQVYFVTEIPQSISTPIYGHYELQPNDVNGRPYFKMGSYGFWWDGLGYWWIGYDIEKGQSMGFAFYDKDVFCPHQLSEWDWKMHDGDTWFMANNKLSITCKCFLLKQNSLNFISKYNLSWH